RAVLAFAQHSAALPHAVSNHLAAAKRDLIPVAREILLHFDQQLGVRQPNAVASRRPVEVGVRSARDREAQRFFSSPGASEEPAAKPKFSFLARSIARSRAPAELSGPSTSPLTP